jgi:hypothetical protein
LAELEDTRQSLLVPTSNKAAASKPSSAAAVAVAKPAASKPFDVLGEADRLLYALSVHGIAPVSGAPGLAASPMRAAPVSDDGGDAEFDSLLSALEAPAAVQPTLQRTVSTTNHYGKLPSKPKSDGPYDELPEQRGGGVNTGYDNSAADDDEIGQLLNDLEEPPPQDVAAADADERQQAELQRILRAIMSAREEFEAAIGETVFAAQEQTGTVDESIVALSTACRTFVTVVREERRAFDDESQQRLGESLVVVSKGTKGLALAAQAIGTVATAPQKMEGILEILQKQLEKISSTVQAATRRTN